LASSILNPSFSQIYAYIYIYTHIYLYKYAYISHQVIVFVDVYVNDGEVLFCNGDINGKSDVLAEGRGVAGGTEGDAYGNIGDVRLWDAVPNDE
jgi:hypothetical protein